MGLRSDSAAGTRFLAAVREGRGIKPTARSVGVNPWTGYRWLREAFQALRRKGLDVEAALAELGCCTAKAAVWDEEFLGGPGDGRHHLRVQVKVENVFWSHYDQSGSLSGAAAVAGVGRSTAYRWLQSRFNALRSAGLTRAAAARQLRLSRERSKQLELERGQFRRAVARQRVSAERHAIRDSMRHVQLLELPRKPTQRQTRLVELETRYWELMRAGISNTTACKILGMHRKSGTRTERSLTIRHSDRRDRHPTPAGTCRCTTGCTLLTWNGWAARSARSPWSSVDTLPRSNVSWTATVTSTGGICHTAPMMPPGFAAVARAHTNWSRILG